MRVKKRNKEMDEQSPRDPDMPQEEEKRQPEPLEEPAAQASDAPEDPLAAAQRECQQLREQNLRAIAELRNVQNRAQRERSEAIRYAEADFAKELLVILDDFERTIESARQTEGAAAVAEGVRIIYDHFLKVLRGRGIEPIEAAGRPFDPTYHEALMRQPSDEHPAGTVLQELAKGYRMHDRVLRAAKVIVSTETAQGE